MKRFKKFALRIAFKYLKDELKANKKSIIETINKKMDLDFFNEDEESEMIEAIYDALVEIGKIVVEKKL